jgi:hypothetical protein
MYLRMTTPQGWEAGHEISDCDMHELIHSFSISTLIRSLAYEILIPSYFLILHGGSFPSSGLFHLFHNFANTLLPSCPFRGVRLSPLFIPYSTEGF